MTTDTHSIAGDSNTGGATYKAGQKITSNVDGTITSVNFMASDNCTICYIYNSAGSLLSSASITAGVATFSQAITNGATYYILGDGNGSGVTRRYQSSGGGYPFNRTNINFILTTYNPTIPSDMEASTDTANVWSVYSITSTAATNITVTPSTLALSTTGNSPIYLITVPGSSPLSMTINANSVVITGQEPRMDIAGTKGTRIVKTNYPIKRGPYAGITKQTGKVMALIPEKSFCEQRYNVGID